MWTYNDELLHYGTLEMLTPHSVSIRTQGYVADGGTEYAVGQPHNSAYANSATDGSYACGDHVRPRWSRLRSAKQESYGFSRWRFKNYGNSIKG